MGLLLCNNTMTATAPELGVIDQRLLWVERVCLEDQRRVFINPDIHPLILGTKQAGWSNGYGVTNHSILMQLGRIRDEKANHRISSGDKASIESITGPPIQQIKPCSSTGF
jgi:hypothetical protein